MSELTVQSTSGYSRAFWIETTGGDLYLPSANSVYLVEKHAINAVYTYWGSDSEVEISGSRWNNLIETGYGRIMTKSIYVSGTKVAYFYRASLDSSYIPEMTSGEDSYWTISMKSDAASLNP